jgi:hypothetical protein
MFRKILEHPAFFVFSELCKTEFSEGLRFGSGWIVAVKGVRKTIHGTAWYQLNHSTLVRGLSVHV